MSHKFRIEMFHELNPARATGSHEGQGSVCLYPLDKLIRFLENGQVGGKVRIKDGGKTEHAQPRNHLTGSDSTAGQTKFFADGDSY